MRARLPLSPSPMRTAGSGLGSRVGLFNLCEEEDNNQERLSVPDGWMLAMVTLPSFSYYQTLTNVVTDTDKGPALVCTINRRSALKSPRSFLTVNGLASYKLSCTVLVVS